MLSILDDSTAERVSDFPPDDSIFELPCTRELARWCLSAGASRNKVRGMGNGGRGDKRTLFCVDCCNWMDIGQRLTDQHGLAVLTLRRHAGKTR